MESKEMDCVLVNAVDEKGFVWSFTLRGADVDSLFEKIEVISAKFDKQGYSPSSHSSTDKYTRPSSTSSQSSRGYSQNIGTCPKCGNNMVMGKNGKPYCKKCYIDWKRSQGNGY